MSPSATARSNVGFANLLTALYDTTDEIVYGLRGGVRVGEADVAKLQVGERPKVESLAQRGRRRKQLISALTIMYSQ